MAGVPLLCLPMGRDQNDNAARVTHRGAAWPCRPMRASRPSPPPCAACWTSRPSRPPPRRLGAAIRADEVARDAAAVLEALAA